MYPQTPESFLLQNDGKGRFTNATATIAPQLQYVGMVTDAKWFDFDHNGTKDLIVVGEWMSPTVLVNNGKTLKVDTSNDRFSNTQTQTQTPNTKPQTLFGWWNTIELADLDNDGDTDILLGNWGLNSQLKCSETEPLAMIYKDFDGNGSVDPFLCCYVQGKQFPYVSRDELLDEIYPMRKKFTSYKSYADAVMTDLFTADELKDARVLTTTNLGTTYLENRNGRFFPHPLPVQAQFSPVYKIVVEDFNSDGFTDLLLLGNNEYARLKLGKMDANFGTLLLNDGKGNFVYSANKDNGLFIAGDVKDALVLRVNGSRYLMVTVNGADFINYKLVQ
jgi:hypothetical protein